MNRRTDEQLYILVYINVQNCIQEQINMPYTYGKNVCLRAVETGQKQRCQVAITGILTFILD